MIRGIDVSGVDDPKAKSRVRLAPIETERTFTQLRAAASRLAHAQQLCRLRSRTATRRPRRSTMPSRWPTCARPGALQEATRILGEADGFRNRGDRQREEIERQIGTRHGPPH